MNDITHSAEWRELETHFQTLRTCHMRDMFAEDSDRAKRFTARCDELFLDYSKNRITQDTMKNLMALARVAQVEDWRSRLFAGDKINNTEQRAVLHTALRKTSAHHSHPEVAHELKRMEAFCQAVHNEQWLGYSGKPIRHIINIGIGGSSLGPEMCVQALRPWQNPKLSIHFVTNVDAHDLQETLSILDPETSLFVVASKTFNTQETIANANGARDWLLNHCHDNSAIAKHFVAVSTHQKNVVEFGIHPDNMFRFWDWVGGRYSIWSSIGLTLALAIGMESFRHFLAGAERIDQHFLDTPLEENLPVILAVLGIWYHNFFGAETHAVIPYAHDLRRLPAYLQQLDMESNGKSVQRHGQPVHYKTGPIIWGEPGTNGQHAFFQLMHQGTRLIPSDFIFAATPSYTCAQQHQMLAANFLAQTSILMRGKTLKEASNESDSQQLACHKVYPGNQPSNSLLLQQLNPKTLGMLIALYEHKVFVQGIIWNLNSFDQWGVELGKQIATQLLPAVQTAAKPLANHDSSTQQLLAQYHSWQ